MTEDLKGSFLRSANFLLHRLGVQLDRTTKHRSLIDFLRDRKVDVVFDVGANHGQFGKELRLNGYSGKIISFEPVSSAFAELASVAAKSQPWEVFQFGLSNSEGDAEINISRYSVFSSLLKETPLAVKFNEGAAVVSTEKIHLKTLDLIFDPRAQKQPFLKIDTQGFERNVLEGAEKSLGCFCGVVMELPIVHLYEGVWEVEEAIAYMRSKGFSLSNVLPINFDLESDAVSLLEVDCVFKKERRG